MKQHIVITGATGFLGKVLLAELLRQHQSRAIASITLLVRARKGVSAQQRVDKQLLPSACFAQLPGAWRDKVHVAAADLSAPGLGLSPQDRADLCAQTTHIIHCAASVDFDRPIAEAAKANIVSSLAMLELAKCMPKLQRFVSTSTAYVTPWREGDIGEVLAPLPRPADALWHDVQAGRDEAELMAETGHANTYTYTKCLAEHLLVQNRGTVPLTLVRPSIISASWQKPFPGWIDSKAAFAGFVVTIGAGLLKVIDGDPKVRLDIVPVDIVVQRLLQAAWQPEAAGSDAAKPQPARILYAVAGPEHSAQIGPTSAAIVQFFREHPIGRRPRLWHMKPRSWHFNLLLGLHHGLPAKAANAYYKARGDKRGQRSIRHVQRTLETINRVFPYFTRRSFRFISSEPMPQGFDVQAYVQLVCRGAYTHLMQRNGTRVSLAGRAAKKGQSDLAWGIGRIAPGSGGVGVAAAAIVARKLFRRVFEEVSFDETSFLRAHESLPADATVLIVPTHRSYVDYVLSSYLFFARPDLGFAVPHVAYADEAIGKPVWRRLAHTLKSFALRRNLHGAPAGAGPAAGLTQLQRDGVPLQIFLEGQRSVSRRVLPPRRDVLQYLQQSGKTCAIVPVAISYERVAEELSFAARARGADKDGAGKHSPMAWLQWLQRAARKQVRLGRVHMQAGEILLLRPQTDLDVLSRNLVDSLERHTVATDAHLRAFVGLHPHVGLDVPSLRRAIIARGGQVLPDSSNSRAGAAVLDVALERSMRQHWQHHFFAELLQLWPKNFALQQMCPRSERPGVRPQAEAEAVHDSRLMRLLQTLAEPMADDFASVLECVRHKLPLSQSSQVKDLLGSMQWQEQDVARAALGALCTAGLLDGAQASATQPPGDDIVLRRCGDDVSLQRLQAACRLGAAQTPGARPGSIRGGQAGHFSAGVAPLH